MYMRFSVQQLQAFVRPIREHHALARMRAAMRRKSDPVPEHHSYFSLFRNKIYEQLCPAHCLYCAESDYFYFA